MKLTGAQHQQIQEALLAAFDEPGLRQLVRQELDADLDAVAGGKNKTEIVLNLIAWAERENRLPALIAGALKQNPTSPALQALAEAAETWHIAAPAEPKTTPPYQGLAYFDVADAERFFGREKLTRELVAYLKDHRFLAVVGASGSGKSSVVRAGVVTALQQGKAIQGSEKWAALIVTPTARPLDSVAVALTKDSESVTAAATLADDMAKNARSLGLHARRVTTGTGAPPRVLLVIDQFEELFTLCKDKGERRAFIDNLLAAAQPDGVTTVILTLRADFYAHCAEYDNLRTALSRDQIYIGAMSQDELRAAIEKPAQNGAWDLEPGLVNRILRDVADEPGALPLLSHALLETWQRRSGRLLTLAGYEAAGGVRGAIAHTADATYAALTPDQQAIARSIFLRLTALGEGVQDTRRRVPLQELASLADVEAVLQRLEDARLVTAVREGEPDAAQPVTFVDVTHEALIREWPRLREWLAEDREGLRLHRKLTEAAAEWDDLGRDPGALYRGVQLQQAQEWAAERGSELNDLERAFLAASVAAVDAERREQERIAQEREAARQRELEQAQALAAARQRETEQAQKLAAEAEARRLAETERAREAEARETEAEGRRVAEAERAAQAEKLAEEQRLRALDQEAAAKRVRRRARIALGVGIVAVSFAIVAALLGWQSYQNAWTAQRNADEAQRNADEAQLNADEARRSADEARRNAYKAQFNADEAQRNADEADAQRQIAQARLQQFGQAIGSIGIDQLLAIATQLSDAGDSSGAATLIQAAAEANPFWIPQIKSAAEANPVLIPLQDRNGAIYRYVPAGGFVMGSSDGDSRANYNEKPQQNDLYLDAFWIMETEVANDQYAKCVQAGVCSEPSNTRWNDPAYAEHPVTDVTWFQANDYAKWAGGRLPTEAEWEKACRGADGRIYPWGNEPPTADLANFYGNTVDATPVGSYPQGASPYGVLDMAGNVSEWTSSQYRPYPYNADDGGENPEADADRTLRGGSWAIDGYFVRCASRGGYSPDLRGKYGGFRLVSPGFPN